MAYEVTTASAPLEYDTRNGFYSSCAKVDSNHFINFWQGGATQSPSVQIIAVDTSTWAVTTAAAPLTYDAGGTYNSCQQIDTNHFINFWRTNTTGGVAQVFTVNTSTWAVTTAAASLTFDVNVGAYQSSAKIDTNHFVVFFQSASADGFVQVFTVNTSTWEVTTASSSLEFDTQNSSYNSCFAIDGNHFINFWLGGAVTTDGFAQVFAVNTSTWAVTTAGTSFMFDTNVGSHNSCYQIDSNHFINFWQGAAGDGFAQVFTVDTSTWAVTTAASQLEFDTTDAGSMSCAQVDSNHFVLFWSGPGQDGYAQVFVVNTTTWEITTTAASIDFDTANALENSCCRIDGAHYINFWRGATSDGFVGIFTVAVQQVVTLTETITVIDSITRTASRFLSEVATVVDSVVSAKIATQLINESIAVTDSLVKTIGRSLSSTISVVDSFSRSIQRYLSETTIVTDTISNLKATGINLSETISVIADVVTLGVRNIILTERILVNAIVTFAARAIGYLLGSNTDSKILYGKKSREVGRNDDTNIKIGKRLR